MAVYDYECAYCGHELKDVVQSIKAAPLFRCPECKTNALARVIYAPMVFVKDTKTIGQLADKNAKTNKSKIQEQKAKDLESQPKEYVPAYKKDQQVSTKQINKMTQKQKEKYIMEGK